MIHLFLASYHCDEEMFSFLELARVLCRRLPLPLRCGRGPRASSPSACVAQGGADSPERGEGLLASAEAEGLLAPALEEGLLAQGGGLLARREALRFAKGCAVRFAGVGEGGG